MKQYWQKLATRIDALTLRERAIVFAMAALIAVVLINALLLDPQYAKQKQLSQRIAQEQAQIDAMQAEIRQKASAHGADPDSATRARLQQLRQQSAQMQASLSGMQQGLVAPDKMASLLEAMLKQNGKLRLISLKTLSASPLGEAAADKKAGEPHAQQAAGKDRPDGETAIWRHGVEIVVQGSYADMVDYMARLETMPWQLFWGQAQLDAGEYPASTLTLTLYTLSLDKKWLDI